MTDYMNAEIYKCSHCGDAYDSAGGQTCNCSRCVECGDNLDETEFADGVKSCADHMDTPELRKEVKRLRAELDAVNAHLKSLNRAIDAFLYSA